MTDTFVKFRPTLEIHGNPDLIIKALIKIGFSQINKFEAIKIYYYKRGEVEIRLQIHIDNLDRDGNATLVSIPLNSHDTAVLQALSKEISDALNK